VLQGADDLLEGPAARDDEGDACGQECDDVGLEPGVAAPADVGADGNGPAASPAARADALQVGDLRIAGRLVDAASAEAVPDQRDGDDGGAVDLDRVAVSGLDAEVLGRVCELGHEVRHGFTLPPAPWMR
jgi:hypothetical protein